MGVPFLLSPSGGFRSNSFINMVLKAIPSFLKDIAGVVAGGFIKNMANAQGLPITDQLNGGIRFLVIINFI